MCRLFPTHRQFVVAFCTIITLCMTGLAWAKPALYLLAADTDYTQRNDPLMADTALRLVGAELAACYGVETQFCPPDRLAKLPPDAYPRIAVSQSNLTTATHLRLQRKGNELACYAADDQYEIELWRTHMQLPARMYVGLFAPTCNQDKPKQAEFSSLRLNGQPVLELQLKDFGKLPQPGTATRNGENWTLTAPGRSTTSDPTVPGTFAYQPCDGDFDLRVNVVKIDGHPDLPWAALMCCSGWGAEDATFGVVASPKWTGALFRHPGWKYLWWQRDWTGHVLHVDLMLDANHKTRLLSLPVTCGSWDSLTGNITAVADGILKSLPASLKADLSSHKQPQPATQQQLDQLLAARQQALAITPSRILAASRRIDQVLNASPTCADAHYAAAGCTALLAAQELIGAFDDRARYLATPLSHLLLARRLSPPASTEHKLVQAWTMLVCGYPDAALAVVETLDEGTRQTPEAKALRMFVTRDYRPLSAEQVTRASSIEQLAWTWAAQECVRNDLLSGSAPRMARKAFIPALLPLYNAGDVTDGHVNTVLLPTLAYSIDASALLRCEDLPAAKRLGIAKKMAAALGTADRAELPALAQAIQGQVLTRGIDDEPGSLVAPLMELYNLALEQPIGPVWEDNALRWQALSPRDFASVQRGIFTLALYRRAYFLGHSWGVSDQAINYCRQLEQAIPGPDANLFFGLLADVFSNDVNRVRASLAALCKSDFGQRLGVVWSLFEARLAAYQNNLLADNITRRAGRGSWDWHAAMHAAAVMPQEQTFSSLARASEVDSHNRVVVDLASWCSGNLSFAEAAYAAMPYHAAIGFDLASRAQRAGQNDLAVRIYSKLIDMMPTASGTYWDLAHLCARIGRRADALVVVESAAEHCSSSVALSNLMGRGAEWAVAEGRLDQALRLGREAAQSYSALGLRGYAVALEANGQAEDALKVYRAVAQRYDSSAADLVNYMIRKNYPTQSLMEELQSLVEKHGDRGRDRIYDALFDAARPDLLDLALQHKVCTPAPRGAEHGLMICALRFRQFEQVLVYADRIAAKQKRTESQLIWSHIAARFTDKADYLKTVEAELRVVQADQDMQPAVDYLVGKSTAEAILAKPLTPAGRAYIHWLVGIDAELRQDLALAQKEYQAAAAEQADVQACYTSRAWAARLQQPAPTTQP